MIQSQRVAVGQTRDQYHVKERENHHVHVTDPTQKIVIDQEVAPQKTTEPLDHQIAMKAWMIKH